MRFIDWMELINFVLFLLLTVLFIELKTNLLNVFIYTLALMAEIATIRYYSK